ncbi:MAG: hypothetical protein MZV64_62330 [Ignavibacteriales bacterium]|nr:hypothetical protein [Ignavibacteriales bacterium]
MRVSLSEGYGQGTAPSLPPGLPPRTSAISSGLGLEMRVASPSNWEVFSVVGDSLSTARRDAAL